jgi:hypothetical protein
MPSYKIEALIRHPQSGAEDDLEEAIHAALYKAGVTGVAGVTAWQVFPHG